jgi:hypothetical protein
LCLKSKAIFSRALWATRSWCVRSFHSVLSNSIQTGLSNSSWDLSPYFSRLAILPHKLT